MIQGLDIIDKLDNEDGFVKLVLTSGKVVYGRPLMVDWLEDENGWDTIKRIAFKPYNSEFERDYGLEDIVSYEPINEEDIPHT